MLFIHVYCTASGNTHLESKAYRILKLRAFISLSCQTCGVEVCSHPVQLFLRIITFDWS